MNSKRKAADDSSSSSDATGSSSEDSSSTDTSSDTSDSDGSRRGRKRNSDKKKPVKVPESGSRKKGYLTKEESTRRRKPSYSRSRSRSGSITKLTGRVKKSVSESERKRSRSKSVSRLQQLQTVDDKVDSEDFSPLKKTSKFEPITKKEATLVRKPSPPLSNKRSLDSPEAKRDHSTSSERELASSKEKPESPDLHRRSRSQDKDLIKIKSRDSKLVTLEKSKPHYSIKHFESTKSSRSPSQSGNRNARSSSPEEILHSHDKGVTSGDPKSLPRESRSRSLEKPSRYEKQLSKSLEKRSRSRDKRTRSSDKRVRSSEKRSRSRENRSRTPEKESREKNSHYGGKRSYSREKVSRSREKKSRSREKRSRSRDKRSVSRSLRRRDDRSRSRRRSWSRGNRVVRRRDSSASQSPSNRNRYNNRGFTNYRRQRSNWGNQRRQGMRSFRFRSRSPMGPRGPRHHYGGRSRSRSGSRSRYQRIERDRYRGRSSSAKRTSSRDRLLSKSDTSLKSPAKRPMSGAGLQSNKIVDARGERRVKDSEISTSESESSSSSGSSSSSSSHAKKKKKHRKRKSKKEKKKKKKMKKAKKLKHKRKSSRKSKDKVDKNMSQNGEKPSAAVRPLSMDTSDSEVRKKVTGDIGPSVLEEAKRFAPKSQAEWEKEQSVVRKEVDEQTGRVRLIKGSGEVLETIVSRQQHKEINRSATKQDGEQFQLQLTAKLK